MRVIAGSAKGRRLVAPPGDRVRPTGDRVRESLFSMLDALVGIEGARVADLCCGTGALGIEALSRGAASVVYVDADARSLRATATNLTGTGFDAGGDAVDLVRSDVVRWAAQLEPGVVDLVLVDPPYAWGEWDELLGALRGKVEVVAAEADHEVEPPPGWRMSRSRRYGGTVLTVFAAAPSDEPA